MTTPQQPGPHIPGFGPAAGYGAEPTQPLPVQPLPTQPPRPQPLATQPMPAQPMPAQPYYGAEQYPTQSYGGQSYPAAAGEPDWTAMADHYEAQGKRKRVLAIAGGALAVCLVGGVTAYAWSTAKAGGASANAGAATSASASASPSGSVSASPTVSASASPHPKSAPALRLDQVFASSLKVGGKSFNRVAIDSKSICWKSTVGGLGNVLAANDCKQVLRATYTSGKVSVTVGVAALVDVGGAMKTAAQFHGGIAPLWHSGDTNFCRKSACAVTHAVEDRFLYLTVAGPNSGAAGSKDSTSISVGHAAAAAVLARLVTLH